MASDPDVNAVTPRNLTGCLPRRQRGSHLRTKAARGGAVEMRTRRGMPHGFFVMSKLYSEALQAADCAGDRLLEALRK